MATVVSADATSGEDSALEEIVVTAHMYKPVDASPAAKILADNHDLPLSVDQITDALLTDRGVISTDEAIDSVAGVRLIPGFPGSSGYLVRGFFETYNVLVDGRRDETALTDPEGIERIDVLKGPPSVLFGANSAGGVINVVTKSPQPQPAYDFVAFGGSYEERRFGADINQPLLDGKLLTRLTASYDDGNSFRDFVSSEARYIAEAVSIKLTDQDLLTLKGSYNKFDFTSYSDFPIDPHFLAVPISRSLGEPGLPQVTSDEYRVSYDYSHDFGQGWRFRSSLGYNRYSVEQNLSRVYSISLEADGKTADRTLEEGPQRAPVLTAQEELYGLFSTGPIVHNIVAGTEYYNEYYYYLEKFASIAPLNIYSPVYGASPGPVEFGYAGESGDHAIAGYLQDLASIGADWKLLAGARYDHDVAFYESYDANNVSSGRIFQPIDHVSPRGGLVYQPVKATSIYASWSKSFYPQIYYNTFGGSILPPDFGEQYEVGVKQDLLDRRLSLAGALFRIKRENVATVDPAHVEFYIAAGQQESKGAELSAAGEVLPHLNVFATYAYTDAKVTQDNTLPVGDRLGGVPLNAASLWSQYELSQGLMRGVGGGLGIVYASRRQASLPNTFSLASYGRVDALLYYRLTTRYRLSLNIKNLNNVRYYDTDGGYVLRPGAPFSVLVSLRADFR